MFRGQIYYRRRRGEESLRDLLHDIRRFVVLAYPVPSNESTQILVTGSHAGPGAVAQST